MYSKIYDFCKVRNKGNCFQNGTEPTPRVKFLIDLIKSSSIDYELHTFDDRNQEVVPDTVNEIFTDKERDSLILKPRRSKFINPYDFDERLPSRSSWKDDYSDWDKNYYFNIFLPGTSNRIVVAHHDINNPNIDNANDNSASCINAIALKLLVPEINVILLDGEEFGGIGSEYASRQIKSGKFGSIEWVLNLELTGKGGDLFFIGDYPGKLSDHILRLFNCPIVRTPFNDSVIFKKNRIDSTVINPLPEKKKIHDENQGRTFSSRLKASEMSKVMMNGKELDTSYLSHCHMETDTVDTISVSDMKVFTENILKKIVTS